jgi:hypothetical protein
MTVEGHLSASPLEADADQCARSTTATLDEPVDAIVYEFHPALTQAEAISADEYPYVPPSVSLPPPNGEFQLPMPRWLSDTLTWTAQAADHYFAALSSPPDFVVPKTFGMSAILGIMTALALLFACLRRLNAQPELYFFFSVEALAICLAQMFYGKAPRLASVVTGAIVLPVFTVLAIAMRDRANAFAICLAIGFVPFGALLGYLTGTCAAGIFLVMDYLEPYLQGRALSGLLRQRPTP